MRKKRTYFNLLVGRPQAYPSMPSHIRGIHMGNAPGRYSRSAGMRRGRDGVLLVTARRSTGINPRRRNPIDPSSPNLAPP